MFGPSKRELTDYQLAGDVTSEFIILLPCPGLPFLRPPHYSFSASLSSEPVSIATPAQDAAPLSIAGKGMEQPVGTVVEPTSELAGTRW